MELIVALLIILAFFVLGALAGIAAVRASREVGFRAKDVRDIVVRAFAGKSR